MFVWCVGSGVQFVRRPVATGIVRARETRGWNWIMTDYMFVYLEESPVSTSRWWVNLSDKECPGQNCFNPRVFDKCNAIQKSVVRLSGLTAPAPHLPQNDRNPQPTHAEHIDIPFKQTPESLSCHERFRKTKVKVHTSIKTTQTSATDRWGQGGTREYHLFTASVPSISYIKYTENVKNLPLVTLLILFSFWKILLF